MVPCIRTVQVKNYKSLANVEVVLEPFTVLAGSNGSGKSNFFDALAFVQESLTESAEVAFGRRGGFNGVVNARELLMQGRRLGPGMATKDTIAAEKALTESMASFGFRFVIELDPDSLADYSLELEAGVMSRLMGAFRVSRERCVITKGSTVSELLREGDRFVKPVKLVHSCIHPEQLALAAVSNLPAFQPTFEFLASMRVYAITPESMRVPQAPDPGSALNRDGSGSFRRALSSQR